MDSLDLNTPDGVHTSAVEALTCLVDAIGGTVREGQRDMAVHAAGAFAAGTGNAVVVSAGTGTGKSMAYGAAVGAAGGCVDPETGEGRTVIVTATKALQTQLETKDMPVVETELGVEVRKLVGISNYVCRSKIDEMLSDRSLEQSQLALDDADEDGTVDGFSELLAELADTSHSGERGDLETNPSDELWQRVSTSTGECTGAECPDKDDCWAMRARTEAREADVVIVNSALYASHLSIVENALAEGKQPPPGIVGRHDRLVVDEIHKFGDAVRSAATHEIRSNVMIGPANAYRSVVSDKNARKTADGLRERWVDVMDDYDTTWFRSGLPDDIAEVIADMRAVILGWRLRVMATSSEDEKTMNRRNRAGRMLENRADTLNEILEAASDPEQVVWCDNDGVLSATPRRVGPWLSRVLWPHVAAVTCSATVPDNIVEQLGMGDSTRIEHAVSPFAYREVSVLYVPEMPDPSGGRTREERQDRRDAHEAAIVDQLEVLIRAAGGRTMSLHTSRAAMRRIHEQVAERVSDMGIRMFTQDDLPRSELIRVFTEDETSVLFGTQGLWEGISVDGDACRVVTIDRLPFAPPGDPVTDAMREDAGEGFAGFLAVDVPHAGQMIAQGAGRLIRTTSDRGVVACFDPRLAEKSYRTRILAALPPMGRTRNIDGVVGFLTALNTDPEACVSVDATGRVTVQPSTVAS